MKNTKDEIISLNEGILAELQIEALEEKAELSPIGALDLLIDSADIAGDLDTSASCESNCANNCSSQCGVNWFRKTSRWSWNP